MWPKNDLVLRALRRQPVDRTPLWMMRQAGRYLPEYRQLRAQAGSFMGLCQNPALACEVTLQPLRRFDLDAAILFSDILTIPDALGMGLAFEEGKGPYFKYALRDEKAIKTLPPLDLCQLDYVYQAIRLIKQELSNQLPLLGFTGSPFTLSAYMIEGKSVPGFPTIMRMINDNPTLFTHLLERLSHAVADHLAAQIDAGADAVMIFDTWGGLLQTPAYHHFSLIHTQTAITKLRSSEPYRKKPVPIILFTRGGQAWLEAMANIGCDALGVDWELSLKEARARVGHQVALQGNLDPAILLQSPANIRQAVEAVLADYGQGEGHIFNLGHGITPDVPPEHVQVLVEAVKEESRPYHGSSDLNSSYESGVAS